MRGIQQRGKEEEELLAIKTAKEHHLALLACSVVARASSGWVANTLLL